MPEYLTVEDLMVAARRYLGAEPEIRDAGLLDSAVARPLTTVFGQEAYPDLDSKGAALLHSIVGNHALVDGNKRLGWTATQLFYGLNGYELVADEDAEYECVIGVAAGRIDDVTEIASRLAGWRRPWR
ncbi:MAG: type II toxin-antitoxin system death-on-curing family toxin [Streptosporangiales bacterium]